MSKGIAKNSFRFSGIRNGGQDLFLRPTGQTVHAKAADVSKPGVTVYATKEQLMTAFTPDASGTNANVGKLLFGINASDTAQGWYILRKRQWRMWEIILLFFATNSDSNRQI